MSGMLTWYSGKDLLNPACGGPDPTDSSLVGAVSASSSKVGSCGDRVRVTKDGNSVVVTIRDWCASCGPNHMDVTKGVFSQIAPLTVGVLQGVTMVKVADDDDGS
ncbi:hypothetical protein K437DRAFT_223814 [Tilletiaria anomala UBC 951]|uniref:RlpA-like protein double-psi beta-barrel domain-containing protein n=1 Tax=Tilletiaria anomala (strain ATCC 24038 / CBS 436.72 / UBC 951) TaxID=1037660 RepID=A0A066W5S0_TILAU|nr:uncharacterized protein K437DRAFT_223814 [Tilletiaria anomala UBC 951]KDN46140.1 hypothetical protein K437DRAFT_223814 [Tilletiaria anomala UBC 951]